MTNRLRVLLGFGALGAVVLAACHGPKPPPVPGPPPPPPSFLKDQPDEVRNGIPVNFTQAKAGEVAAPDPLALRNGKRIAKANQWWSRRRPEIFEAFQENQHGRTPGMSVYVREEIFDKATPVFNGLAVRRQATLHLLNAKGSAEIDVATYLPVAAHSDVPVVLNLGFSPNMLMTDDAGVKEIQVWSAPGKRIPGRDARVFGKLDVEAYLRRGVGVALVYYGQIEPDFEGAAPLGVRNLFGMRDGTSRGPDDWGAIGAWAWGASKVLDYLVKEPGVDPKRIVLQGVSRLGKTALWAGAQDPRFAMVIASCSGEGGAALSRRNYGETIAHIEAPAGFPYWFAPKWADFAANPASSPVDSDLLLSLIAPRPLLLITASDDAWADPYGEFLAARAASPVWQLLGKRGIADGAYPPLDHVLMGDIAFVTHNGGHGTVPQDTGFVLDFIEKKLPPPKTR